VVRNARTSVLVVDDDASTRFVLARTLEGLGLQAHVVEDGMDVGEIIAKERFDLLVIDLYMPGMNGFELLRQIRKPAPGLLPVPKTPNDVPIFVVSGECAAESVANIKALGANLHIPKPIDINEFEDHVRAALRARGEKSVPRS
jgi:CheY-like chemotaxis protein